MARFDFTPPHQARGRSGTLPSAHSAAALQPLDPWRERGRERVAQLVQGGCLDAQQATRFLLAMDIEARRRVQGEYPVPSQWLLLGGPMNAGHLRPTPPAAPSAEPAEPSAPLEIAAAIPLSV